MHTTRTRAATEATSSSPHDCARAAKGGVQAGGTRLADLALVVIEQVLEKLERAALEHSFVHALEQRLGRPVLAAAAAASLRGDDAAQRSARDEAAREGGARSGGGARAVV